MEANQSKLKALIFTDIHYTGIMPDAIERLKDIIKTAYDEKADCIICLGDTAWSKPEYQDIADVWNGIKIPHYMILGNHDMDRNTKDEVIEFYQMPSKYYAFDQKGVRFLAMDTNYCQKENSDDKTVYDYDNANYADKLRDCMSDEELEWLENQLENSDKPLVLLSHAQLYKNTDEDPCCQQHEKITEICVNHNNKHPETPVFMCCHGHNHIDSYLKKDGINYLGINSASNQWLEPGQYTQLEPNEVFGEQDHKKFDCLKYTIPYKDAVYALMTIDTENKTVYVKPRISEFVGPPLKERGGSGYIYGLPVTPCTQERNFKF